MLTNSGVKMYEGEGRVIDAHTVEVREPDGTKKQYTAKNILIATGSRAQRVSIPGKVYTIVSKLNILCDQSTRPHMVYRWISTFH